MRKAKRYKNPRARFEKYQQTNGGTLTCLSCYSSIKPGNKRDDCRVNRLMSHCDAFLCLSFMDLLNLLSSVELEYFLNHNLKF